MVGMEEIGELGLTWLGTEAELDRAGMSAGRAFQDPEAEAGRSGMRQACLDPLRGERARRRFAVAEIAINQWLAEQRVDRVDVGDACGAEAPALSLAQRFHASVPVFPPKAVELGAHA
jgi:hypothetical protein